MSIFNFKENKPKKRNKEVLKVERIYHNNYIHNIYAACTSCYNNQKDISYREKKEYIKKRVKSGHDSILEHGIVVYMMTGLRKENYTDYINLFKHDAGFYIHHDTNLYVSSRVSMNSVNVSFEEDDVYSIVIGGSIRGIKHFIKINMLYNSLDNKYFRTLLNYILTDLPLELFEDILSDDYILKNYIKESINTGILDIPDRTLVEESLFNNGLVHYAITSKRKVDYNGYDNKSVIVGFDSDSNVRNFYNILDNNGFDQVYLYKVLPVTVCFLNMSRTATHQLVRHRNAITQESQRYTSYKDSSFTSPDTSEYLSKDTFNIKIFGHTAYNITLKDLGNELLKIYNQLVDQKVKKEDARAFLPSNVNCGKLYMTFTYDTLCKFLKLRTDSHAQAEIRAYASVISDIVDILDDCLTELIIL